jgi:hypothetical protein
MSVTQTIGVGHFLKGIADVSLNKEVWSTELYRGAVFHNTFSIETLLWGLGHSAWTPLEEAPEVRAVLEQVQQYDPIEDFQYILSLEDNQIVFRPVSILGDYVVQHSGGRVLEARALLTHFKDQYCGFTNDEIQELESLINNPRTRELELQEFFEVHPHFFRMWDFREIHPHVYLVREDDEPLIPDFILTNPILR